MNESDPTTGEAAAEADARSRYAAAADQIDGDLDRLARQDARYGTIRVALFLAALALGFLGAFATPPGPFRVAAGVAVAAFFVAVVMNEPVRERLEMLRRRRAVLQRLGARLDRDWAALADPQLGEQLQRIRLTGAQREVARDLDLLGDTSLFQLVSMAATTPGIETLARWLTGPAIEQQATERARAIEVLAPRLEERLRFYSLARDVGRGSGDPTRFVRWATGPLWLGERPWLRYWAAASGLLAAGLLLTTLAAAVGAVPIGWKAPGVLLLCLGVFNLLLAAVALGPAHEIFSIAMASRRAVDEYRELFAAAAWLPEGPHGQDASGNDALARIRAALLVGEDNATEGMLALGRVAKAGGLRQSAGTFLLYLPLQAWGLWDVWVLARLEAWQSRYGVRTESWFDALGQMEALLSLAALRDEYPQWATPSWRGPGGEAVVSGEAVGHPLLPDPTRVCNDVEIGPPGTFLLITGSNMSGKSTMLRSVGLNVALAAAGAPVCARRFALPSLELATSIRVTDDLSQGVSFYMAELHRLKSVVDHARGLAGVEDRVQLFLLDEILQGTNSRERQIAVVQVLRTLSASGAIGAITTHDLELADEPELRSAARTVHFRETIEVGEGGQERMSFDYRMRPGVSPTTNALKLLEMVGLGGSSSESPSGRGGAERT